MRVYVTDGSSVCLLLQNLLCMCHALHCFKMQDKLGSMEEVLLQGAGHRTVLSLWRKKADCLIPQRTWIETSGHRAGQTETTNTEAKQKRANCKPLRGVGLCYQQWAGFFSAQRWQRKGKLPKNPEGYFRVHSTEKTLKVMGPIGKDAGKDQHTITQ